MSNLKIYDVLREFHKNEFQEIQDCRLTSIQQNAVDALNSVLYLVEGVFSKEDE